MIIIEIAGHLGADPETRFTPNGQKVTTLRVATNVRKAGKDETVWWRVTIWGDRFDKMLVHFKKGSSIIVIGEMQKPEIYTDKMGVPQVSLELTAELIRFSPFGKGDKNGEQQSHQGSQSFSQGSGQSYGSGGGQKSFDTGSNEPFASSQSTFSTQYGQRPSEFLSEEDQVPF